jgi:DNA-binding transcriptional LysR family regulator
MQASARMNLNQLRVFFFVAREQSFTRAARLLNITQPAVSIRVSELERDCGARLFDRVGQKVILTDAGDTLYGYALRIFRLLEDAHHGLENARLLKSGDVRIGTGQTATDFISPILHRFKRMYPGVMVRVELGNSQKILADILSLQLHAGVVANPPADSGLVAIPCVREPLAVVVPTAHAWAKQRTLSLKALHGEPFILREPGSGTRALIERALQHVGATPRIEMELPLNPAIKSAVEAGIGVAIMPISIVRPEMKEGRLAAIQVRDYPLVMQIDWIFLEDRAESRLLQALRSALEDT